MRRSGWSSDGCSSDLFYLVRPRHAKDRFDLVCDKYEIAAYGGSAVPGWLKVDRGRRAHRRRSLHIAVHQPLGARKAVLEDATGRLALKIGRASCRERVCQ